LGNPDIGGSRLSQRDFRAQIQISVQVLVLLGTTQRVLRQLKG
jgi:hypothetical protein